MHVLNTSFSPAGLNKQFNPTDTTEQNTLIDLLEEARPSVNYRQACHPGIIFGLGLIGGFALTQFFGSNNPKDVDKLNRQLIKQNKLVKLTNERIDIATR